MTNHGEGLSGACLSFRPLPAGSSMAHIDVVPLTVDHLRDLGAPDLYEYASAPGSNAYCALDQEGKPIAAGGIYKLWEGRGYVWFTHCEFDWRYWPAVTRAVEAAAAWALEHGYQRLEMTVYDGIEKAVSWAEILGFHLEARSPKIMPGGEDGLTYVRIA